MKKFNTSSAQYEITQPHKNNPNPPNPNSMSNKEKLTNDRHAFVSNIAASGFKQFRA